MNPKARKIHLTPAQRAAILALISRYPVRPTSAQYLREEKALRALPVGEKPKASKIPNTLPGFGSVEVKLTPAFDARRDLPEGWAVYSRYDSGGNHGIGNAALHVWTSVWNSWSDGAPFDLAARAAAPTGYGETISSLLND